MNIKIVFMYGEYNFFQTINIVTHYIITLIDCIVHRHAVFRLCILMLATLAFKYVLVKAYSEL